MDASSLTWLDLCCGLKGSCQPAIDRGWKVITVDIDPRFEPDICADLLDGKTLDSVVVYLKALHIKPTFIWASPVCTEFTKAGLPPTWAANRKNPPQPDTALTRACRRLIMEVEPTDGWAIENVLASRSFLKRILGPAWTIVDGHVLWGAIPCLIPQTRGHKWKLPPSSDRAAIRAKIPYEIGTTICRAIEAKHGIG